MERAHRRGVGVDLRQPRVLLETPVGEGQGEGHEAGEEEVRMGPKDVPEHHRGEDEDRHEDRRRAADPNWRALAAARAARASSRALATGAPAPERRGETVPGRGE